MNTTLAIWSSYYKELSPEDALLEFLKCGISCTELSDEHGEALLARGDAKTVGAQFGAFAREHGFSIPQGHLWLKIRLCEEGAVEKLKAWIELFEAIGIERGVLHPDWMANGETRREKLDENIKALLELKTYLAGRKFMICLENMPGLTDSIEDLEYILDALDSPNFGICLDTGHLNIAEDKDQRRFILKAGSRLKALHVHNNDGTHDQHVMPYGRGDIDFDAVVQALREVEYDGIFNYEIPWESIRCPLVLRNAKLDFIKKGHAYMMR